MLLIENFRGMRKEEGHGRADCGHEARSPSHGERARAGMTSQYENTSNGQHFSAHKQVRYQCD
jgi:hypothetical protein